MNQFVNICGRDIKVEGGLIRTARVDGEKYCFLNDPEPVVDGLRKSSTRIDLFTFMQRLPETSPKYQYPMEWDNFAALPISTFDNWWTKQIGFKARNKAKQAEKRGLALREIPFDDALIRGVASYALELFGAVPNLDAVYVPIGMGSGICGTMAVRDALGLATHQMAGFDPEKAKKLFGIPDEYVMGAAIALGYQGEPAALGDKTMIERETEARTRKPLSEFVFKEWGEKSEIAG